VVEENTAKLWKEKEYKGLKSKDKNADLDEEHYTELMDELNRLI
jgi:hypothetical protein